jgi:hypothetical protein
MQAHIYHVSRDLHSVFASDPDSRPFASFAVEKLRGWSAVCASQWFPQKSVKNFSQAFYAQRSASKRKHAQINENALRLRKIPAKPMLYLRHMKTKLKSHLIHVHPRNRRSTSLCCVSVLSAPPAQRVVNQSGISCPTRTRNAPYRPVTPCNSQKNKKNSRKAANVPVGVHASACPHFRGSFEPCSSRFRTPPFCQA